MRETNTAPPGLFTDEMLAHFMLNLDETCFMCCDGKLKIVGALNTKHHDKNVADNRTSITVVQVGNAAGNNGPVIFILKGKGSKVMATFLDERLIGEYDLPPGSTVLFNDSAYMDDVTWAIAAEKIAVGIRQMPVIRDFPEWWACCTCDGFGSHVNVSQALEAFYREKIHLPKEEAATSVNCQPYDQQQAKADKSVSREYLGLARSKVRGHIDQFNLLGILCVCFKSIDSTTWTKSFRAVNLDPRHRVGFDVWTKRIEKYLKTGESTFKRQDCSMFKAMPAVWKNLKVTEREELFNTIDEFTEAAGDEINPWLIKENIYKVIEYVALKDVQSIKTCYMVAKKNPEVIMGEEGAISNEGLEIIVDDGSAVSEITTGTVRSKTSAEIVKDSINAIKTSSLQSFSYCPAKLVENIKKNRDAIEPKMDLFKHMCNFTAREEGLQQARARERGKGRDVMPSDFLDCAISVDNKNILNPGPLDTILGHILEDSKGWGAKARLPKRRLNMIDGNISSYCTVLNGPDRLNLVREANLLAGVLGDIDRERTHAKEIAKKQKEKEDAEKEERSKIRNETAEKKKEEGLERCIFLLSEIEQKGVSHVPTLLNDDLKVLIRYHFESDLYKKGKKEDWVRAVTELYNAQIRTNDDVVIHSVHL